jgi:hypothetical protein
MRYVRALGWAALAGAPILLGALAVVTSVPDVPASLVTHAAIASWIAGALAFSASLLRARGSRIARVPMAMSALVAVGFCAFLLWLASAGPRLVALDERERADLVRAGDRLEHPRLRFSIARPELDASESLVRESQQSGGEAWARAHRVWAWEGDDTQLIVDVSRAVRADAATLRASLSQLERSLEGAGHAVEMRSRDLDGDVEARISDGGTVLARVTFFARGSRAYRLAITIVTREPERWRSWLQQLRT